MLWNLSNDDREKCCWIVFLFSRQRVPFTSVFLLQMYMLVLLILQMFSHVGPVPTENVTCVGPVPAENVYTCWSCSYWKCLHVLVLFLLKMSTHVGPVPSENVYMCWSCYCRKCLHMLVRFLLQMSTCVGPVTTGNVYRFLLQMSACAGSVTTANVIKFWSCSFCLHVMVRFLLQMSACVGPNPVKNVFMSLSVPTANVC